MPDTNMERAHRLGKNYHREPKLYKQYRRQITPQMVAMVVHTLDFPLVNSREITYKSVHRIITIFLRWWSGCLSMAKIIALETRDGKNTPSYRKRASKKLLTKMRKDPIFADGVHAAIAFKRLRKQEWSFEGFDNAVFHKMVHRRDIK